MLMNPETWQTGGTGGGPLPIWQRVIVKNGSLVVLETGKAFKTIKMQILLTPINTQKE